MSEESDEDNVQKLFSEVRTFKPITNYTDSHKLKHIFFFKNESIILFSTFFFRLSLNVEFLWFLRYWTLKKNAKNFNLVFLTGFCF